MDLNWHRLWLVVILLQAVGYGAAKKVAIIGAGIGGSSTAHFLRQLRNDVQITVYEKEKVVGGRMTTVQVGGQTFEAGGTFLHLRNEYMRNLTTSLGLKVLPHEEDESVGIYTGKHFHFYRTGSWIWDHVVMLARYKLSLLKVHWLATDLMDKFVHIYEAQANDKPPVESLSELLRLMDTEGTFNQLMQQNAREYFIEAGLSEKAVDELVSALVRVIYNQDVSKVSAFVAVASLVASQSGLWHVSGGNYRVCQRLLEQAKVNSVTDTVTSIERNKGKYKVRTSSGKAAKFDAVVVATPLQLANISLVGFSKPTDTLSSGAYHQTFVTFVKGWPKREAVGLNPHCSNGTFPEGVLTVSDDEIPFMTIQQCLTSVSGHPVRGTPVWKIQSRRPLTESELKSLFKEVKQVVAKSLYAYPEFSTFAPADSTPFVLDDGVFYTSSVEWATSAMEMSAIAGQNAAKLVHRTLKTQAPKKQR